MKSSFAFLAAFAAAIATFGISPSRAADYPNAARIYVNHAPDVTPDGGQSPPLFKDPTFVENLGKFQGAWETLASVENSGVLHATTVQAVNDPILGWVLVVSKSTENASASILFRSTSEVLAFLLRGASRRWQSKHGLLLFGFKQMAGGGRLEPL